MTMATTDRISITWRGHTVYWELDNEQAALAVQTFVQQLGPAKEEE
jgi:hypothetical protein